MYTIEETLKKLHADHPLVEIYNHAKWNRQYSPYLKRVDIKEKLKRFEMESQELHEAKTMPHFCEELGDVLFEMMVLIILAEEQGYNVVDIVAQRLNKQVWRAPKVYEGVMESEEKHNERWHKRKAEEKTI